MLISPPFLPTRNANQQDDDWVNAAMPGVRVGVEYRPPGAIPVKPGLVYLRVDQAGDYWNDILGSGTIAIYQPIDPQKVDLRLIAVQASK